MYVKQVNINYSIQFVTYRKAFYRLDPIEELLAQDSFEDLTVTSQTLFKAKNLLKLYFEQFANTVCIVWFCNDANWRNDAFLSLFDS